MKNQKGNALLKMSLVAIIAIIVLIMIYYNGSDFENSSIGGDLDGSRHVNTENAGSKNTQVKGITTKGSVSVNTGSQSGN